MADRPLDDIAREYRPEADFDRHLIRYGAGLIDENSRDGTALELGCAEGFMTELLLERFERIVALDGAASYVEAARNRLGAKVELHTCLFDEFETDERFDNVIMARVLEHIDDPVSLLARAAGWLAPGGVVHVIVPNARALNRRIGVEMGFLGDLYELHDRDRRFGHVRVYDLELLTTHVEEAGLRVTASEGVLLKPLSNAQMESWEPKAVDALFAVGRGLPDYCSEIYVTCEQRGGAKST